MGHRFGWKCICAGAVAALMAAGAIAAEPATLPAPKSATPEPLPANMSADQLAAVDVRVDKLLSQLTTEEKISLLGGVDEFYTNPIPRLGIPRLKMMDGPVGTRNDGPSTAYPAGIMLASTWNPALAREEGAAIGRDGRARGCHIQLGPAVNIYRVPTNGRNFEYFGEDPYLAGRMAVGYVQGLQGEGVAASVKHYAANNQERDRGSVNVIVDERALQEIYLPAFKAAVQEGGAWTLMAAYNRVNGPYCTANDYLQNQVLRHDWGFNGLVMSDWGATHGTLDVMNGGLDLEMPGPAFLKKENILPLLADGRITQATLDAKIRRLLRMMVAMGFLDRPQKLEGVPLNDAKGEATALQVAREGLVLLKNEGLLPLDRAKAKNIVVIGPNADPAIVGGGGSAYTQPAHSTSVLKGLTTLAGSDTKVAYLNASTTRELETALAQAKYESPLHAVFYANRDLTGQPVAGLDEPDLNHDWKDQAPTPDVKAQGFSARWTTRIKAPATGPYAFVVRSDDGYRIKLDGRTIGEDWNNHAVYTAQHVRDLEAGRIYDLAIEYFNDRGLAELRFGWMPLPAPFTPEEQQQVKQADTVIACVGFKPATEGESSDRQYAIPIEQQRLLSAAMDLNPRTVVVVNAGGSVDMNGFADRAPSILYAWYPGQAGGQAVAEALFGDINPSGKLPASFERKWEDNPSFGNYPGRWPCVEYAESIFVGYRHYDHKNIEPRFPFGYGLSYTTFKLSNLKRLQERELTVSVDVTNTGPRAGAEVVQLYLAPLSPVIARPVRELKRFEKVMLQPGETRQVRFTVMPQDFARFDLATRSWKVDAGDYEIQVGTSSRDLPLKARVSQ